MEYIYGTAVIDGITRENLKVINGAALTVGEYFATAREHDDSIVTDRCRIERLYKTVEGADGRRYDFYLISDHYRYVDRAKSLGGIAEAGAIAFVAMSEMGELDDVTAGEHAELFAEWTYPVEYAADMVRRYQGKLYRCLQWHISQEEWTPNTAVSQWAMMADPTIEWPEWSQPIGAHDAYKTGDKVTHLGKKWISTVDANVWDPMAYGWKEVTEE